MTLPLLPQDAFATSAHLHQFSAIAISANIQQRKPRHPKRPQLPPRETGTPTKRIVHTAVYKQKLTQNNDALKLHELLTHQAVELSKIIQKVNTLATHFQTPSQSKLSKFNSNI